MNLWLDATSAALFAAAGAWLGHLFSRLRRPYWTFGYFIPLALILIYDAATHYPALSFYPPVSWMMMGRKHFAVMGFIAAMVLTTPISRLQTRRDRIFVFVLMAVVAFVTSVWPFLAPVFSRHQLASLQTRIGADGVCLQTTDYTCGPAAAVTALRKLGLPAEESKIAILSGASSTTGTQPDMLAEALQNEYGKDGLVVEYRGFKNLVELKQAGLTIVVVKFAFLVDHYVTVFEVTDSDVVIGDPLNGLDRVPFDEFVKKWRFAGIVLKRRP